MSRMVNLSFPEEPDQSDSFHKRKRWACWVYRVVLTLLATSSFGISIYAVYQVRMDENGATGGSYWKPHEITPDTSYRMWNPVSMSNDGLLLLNPSNGNVHCNGSFSGGGSRLQGLSTVMTSEIAFDGSDDIVLLLFNHSGKEYVLTADTKKNGFTVLPHILGTYPPNSRFTFDYYWSYTFFQYKPSTSSTTKFFLGCDSTGKATLVDGMEVSDYPNPQALFILNKV